MPIKGSQHDQMKTLDMAQVKSGEWTSWSIITMRIAEATQTLFFHKQVELAMDRVELGREKGG